MNSTTTKATSTSYPDSTIYPDIIQTNQSESAKIPDFFHSTVPDERLVLADPFLADPFLAEGILEDHEEEPSLDDPLSLKERDIRNATFFYKKNPLFLETYTQVETTLTEVLKQAKKDAPRLRFGYNELFGELLKLPRSENHPLSTQQKLQNLFAPLLGDLPASTQNAILSSVSPEALHTILFLSTQTALTQVCEEIKMHFPGLYPSSIVEIPSCIIIPPSEESTPWTITYTDVKFPIKHIEHKDGRELIGEVTANITFEFFTSSRKPHEYNGRIDNTFIDTRIQANVTPQNTLTSDKTAAIWTATAKNDKEWMHVGSL
jgi:hypothetical protein